MNVDCIAAPHSSAFGAAHTDTLDKKPQRAFWRTLPQAPHWTSSVSEPVSQIPEKPVCSRERARGTKYTRIRAPCMRSRACGLCGLIAFRAKKARGPVGVLVPTPPGRFARADDPPRPREAPNSCGISRLLLRAAPKKASPPLLGARRRHWSRGCPRSLRGGQPQMCARWILRPAWPLEEKEFVYMLD